MSSKEMRQQREKIITLVRTGDWGHWKQAEMFLYSDKLEVSLQKWLNKVSDRKKYQDWYISATNQMLKTLAPTVYTDSDGYTGEDEDGKEIAIILPEGLLVQPMEPNIWVTWQVIFYDSVVKLIDFKMLSEDSDKEISLPSAEFPPTFRGMLASIEYAESTILSQLARKNPSQKNVTSAIFAAGLVGYWLGKK